MSLVAKILFKPLAIRFRLAIISSDLTFNKF